MTTHMVPDYEASGLHDAAAPINPIVLLVLNRPSTISTDRSPP
jgi:hypothetical protein